MRYEVFLTILVLVTGTFAAASYGMSNPTSMSVSFLTYLGGSGEEWLRDVCFDDDGNIWVLGYTESTDLPLQNAIQESYGGQGDAIIAKFNPQHELEFCTYFGGDGTDYAMALDIDQDGNLVVVGHSDSTNLFTLNPLQANLNGTSDSFITKFSPEGTVLFSTYFGGSGVETLDAFVIDENGNYVMVGSTGSYDLPTTEGVLQQTYGGYVRDMMIVSMSPDGQSLVFCSYFGGPGEEEAINVALDADGNIGIVGIGGNNDLVSAGAFQQEYGGGQMDAIVAKFTPSCDSILWCTLIGGDGWEFGDGISFDSDSNAIISGYTGSSDFPIANQIMEDKGGYDAFLARLNNDGSELHFSTYFGGGLEDRCYGMEVLSDDSVIILCPAASNDMPVINPWQSNNRGGSDAFLAAFNAADELIYATYVGGSYGDYAMGIDVMNEELVAFTGYTASDDLGVVNPTQAINAGDYDGFLCVLNIGGAPPSTILYIVIGLGIVTAIALVLVFIRKRR